MCISSYARITTQNPDFDITIKDVRKRYGKEDTCIVKDSLTFLFYENKHDDKYTVYKFENQSAVNRFQAPKWAFNALKNPSVLAKEKSEKPHEHTKWLLFMGLRDEGLKLQELYISENRDSTFGYIRYATILGKEGMADSAIAVMNLGLKSVSTEKMRENLKMNMMSVLIKSKRYEQAISYAHNLLKEPNKFDIYHINYNLACAYALVNDSKNALQCLEITSQDPKQRCPRSILAKDTDFDNIRDTEEFQKILTKFPQK